MWPTTFDTKLLCGFTRPPSQKLWPLHNAPQHVIVYADVAVNQLVPGGDDHAPRNLRVVPSNRFGYVGGGFAHEFNVTHCGVVAHGIGGKFCSARSLCERQNAFTNPIMSLI